MVTSYVFFPFLTCFFSCNLLCFAVCFALMFLFFISIISFFISFISFDNTQKTIYRTAKENVISFSFTGRFRRAVVIITGLVLATIVCQVDNEGVFMFVDEVIVHLSLLYDLVNVIAGVSPPVGANECFGDLRTPVSICSFRILNTVERLTPVASTVRRM